MGRTEILAGAERCINGSRQEDYGKPENNFKRIADYWMLWKGIEFTEHDVAMMMALMKVARVQAGTKEDSYVDLCGYVALAGELDQRERGENGI